MTEHVVCSFCGKYDAELSIDTGVMFQGEKAVICSECIALCTKTLEERKPAMSEEPYVFRRYNIDRKQFHLFLADREDDTQSLRLGQHFIVTFVPGLHWPELFYEENPNVSTIMCLDFIDKYNSVMNNELAFTSKQELKIRRLEQDHRELKKEVAALRKIIVEIRQNKQPEDDTND